MEAPKCKFCGKVEWRHVCGGATNIATNTERLTANNRRKDATNARSGKPVKTSSRNRHGGSEGTVRESSGEVRSDPVSGEIIQTVRKRDSKLGNSNDRTLNRRDRKAYNAYQREYMSGRRDRIRSKA